MSSIKPEVHNVSLSRQRRTKPWPQVTFSKILVKIGRALPKNMIVDKHTHTHTDMLVTILRLPIGGTVTTYVCTSLSTTVVYRQRKAVLIIFPSDNHHNIIAQMLSSTWLIFKQVEKIFFIRSVPQMKLSSSAMIVFHYSSGYERWSKTGSFLAAVCTVIATTADTV